MPVVPSIPVKNTAMLQSNLSRTCFRSSLPPPSCTSDLISEITLSSSWLCMHDGPTDVNHLPQTSKCYHVLDHTLVYACWQCDPSVIRSFYPSEASPVIFSMTQFSACSTILGLTALITALRLLTLIRTYSATP